MPTGPNDTGAVAALDPAQAGSRFRAERGYTASSRVRVSLEAGSSFDQTITGSRAEEALGCNAEPYVRTGKFVKILGL